MISAPPGPFPRRYTYKGVWRYIGIILGSALLVGAPWAVFMFWAMPGIGPKLFTLALLPGFVAAACMVLAPFRQSVTLDADKIAVTGILSTRQIAYADIAAKKRIPANYPVWAILPSEGRGRPVRFDMGYNFDLVFKDWFGRIPEQ